MTTQDFITKAKAIHGNCYDYSKVVYIDMKTKVIIECPTHGVFMQTPNGHIHTKSGCPKCGKITAKKAITTTKETFIDKSGKIHNNLYDYSKVVYVNSKTKVTIKCPYHGDFEQLPTHHVRGVGCPKCKNVAFNSNTPATLYFVKIKNKEVYKLGVTSKKNVLTRFEQIDRDSIELLFTHKFTLGVDALYNEQLLLFLTKSYEYKGKPLLASGNKELITKNITETLKEFKWFTTPKNMLKPL